jgi:hypothetical protein
MSAVFPVELGYKHISIPIGWHNLECGKEEHMSKIIFKTYR